ncbi:MAG: hypothetical protein IT373_14615 [Polyangiaceae bacterium]|nr:hypothetical protein [Polyangiaceae bacterium]
MDPTAPKKQKKAKRSGATAAARADIPVPPPALRRLPVPPGFEVTIPRHRPAGGVYRGTGAPEAPSGDHPEAPELRLAVTCRVGQYRTGWAARRLVILLAVLGGLALANRGEWLATMAIAAVPVLLGVAYVVGVALWNRTTILVATDTVQIRHRPFHWFGDVTVEARAILQLHVESELSDRRYDLVARLDTGDEIRLLRSIEREGDARYLEQAIEAALDITDEHEAVRWRLDAPDADAGIPY